VFIFAGPHNWVEFRYFASRMPARWGPLRTFFLTAIIGTIVLTAAFIVLAVVARDAGWERNPNALLDATAAWNSTVILWIAALVALRHRPRAAAVGAAERGRRWLLPLAVGFACVAGVWLEPVWWSVGLVYLHPLVALWFLDREIARRRPAWQRAYRRCLLALPAALALLWWRLADAPPLAGSDLVSMMLATTITQHAGSDVVTGVSSHALVSTHTFLEMIHYGVWIVAIPVVAMGAKPWDLADTPIARKSAAWKWGVAALGVIGLVIVVVLWGGFLVNYPLTRDLYFTIAIGHILAEVSFLLRLP
jgi:hypothetical protein